MHRRVVLGASWLGQTAAESLTSWPGSVLAVCDDAADVETLREEGITAEEADPTDPAALRSLLDDVDSVLVAAREGATNVAAARAAADAFPDAPLVAYTGDGDDADVTDALAEIADEVVDRGQTSAEFLLSRIGDGGIRARQLLSTLRNLESPLGIFTHDNPDPDAIASAVALQRLASKVGVDADICYFGEITHQENRAFVNLLEFDLRQFDDDEDVSEYGSLALVDHSGPGVNDQLPSGTDVDVVVDHHPPRAPVEARYVDLRSQVGATSTLMTEYLRTLEVDVPTDIATGLLFGIRVDTHEFTRETSPADFEAAAYLLPHVDMGTLERIESPSVSPDTFDTIASAIQSRKQHGPILLSCVGTFSDRDALAQAADRLLNLENATVTMVYGVRDGTIYASARARGANVDLGEALREAFGQIGSAGGHADMAGAQISLGLLETVDAGDESLIDIVETVVTDRFLDALDIQNVTPTATELYVEDAPFHKGIEPLGGALRDTQLGDPNDESKQPDGVPPSTDELSDDTADQSNTSTTSDDVHGSADEN